MKRPSRQIQRGRRRSRHNVRQTVAVIAIGALLAVGLFATGEYVTAGSRAPVATVPANIAASAGDDEIYTGSILYMHDYGRTCRQLLFDNRDGRFTDNGYVDCRRAAYRSPTEPVKWSAARARVIADGFRQH